MKDQVADRIMTPGFTYEVIRTDRKKTASIKIDEGRVCVVVPKGLSRARIVELVNRRKGWIERQLQKYEQVPVPKPKQFVNGEPFLYLGKEYRLELTRGKEATVRIQDGVLLCPLPKRPVKDHREYMRRKLSQWYKGQAELELAGRVEQLTAALNVKPASIRIRNYRARWGSCSSTGDMTFNWRIMMAPERIIDYVVVHEYCHLLELNHSARFWKSVGLLLPDWKACRNWLGLYGRTLLI